MISAATRFTLCVLLGCVVLGCSRRSPHVGESESHFLQCAKDSDCGPGMHCAGAGVCQPGAREALLPEPTASPAPAAPPADEMVQAPANVGAQQQAPNPEPVAMQPQSQPPVPTTTCVPAARMTATFEALRTYGAALALPEPPQDWQGEFEMHMDFIPFTRGMTGLTFEDSTGTGWVAPTFENGTAWQLPYKVGERNTLVFRFDRESGMFTIVLNDLAPYAFNQATSSTLTRLLIFGYPYQEDSDFLELHTWSATLGPTLTIAYDGGAPVDMLAQNFCGRGELPVAGGVARSSCAPATAGDLSTCPADCTVELESAAGITNSLDWLLPSELDIRAQGTARVGVRMVPFPELPSSLVLQQTPGKPAIELEFADGMVAGLPYDRSDWNDVEIVVDFDQASYEVSVNGEVSEPFALPELPAGAALSLSVRSDPMPGDPLQRPMWLSEVSAQNGSDEPTVVKFEAPGTQLYAINGDVKHDCAPF